jgi:hypothetical protein
MAWSLAYALLVRKSPTANLAAGALTALLIASLWYLPHSDIATLLLAVDEERATQAGGLFNVRNWLRYGAFFANHHMGRLALWIVVPAFLVPWLWVAVARRQWLNRRAALLVLSMLSGVVALMLISQTSPRNLVPLLPQFAILVAAAFAWYPRPLRYAIGGLTLAVLLTQWTVITTDRLADFRQAMPTLWVLPEVALAPASGPTDPAWWIAPEIVAEVTRGSDERQTLAELVTTGWLHRGQLRYLSQIAGKRVRYVGLTEVGADWEQLIRSSWVLMKSGDPGSVDTPATFDLLERINGGDALFHALYAPVRQWTLPDGEVVTLLHRQGILDWDRLEFLVEPWKEIAETIRAGWSDEATLVYARGDLGVLVGRYDPAQEPVIVLKTGGEEPVDPLARLVGTVFAVLSPGEEETAQWLEDHGYRAFESGDDEGWVAVYGFPAGALRPLPAQSSWRGQSLASVESLVEVAPGAVLPLRVSTSGAGDGDLKWSVRILDGEGAVVASNDRPLGPPDKFGLFVPPSTPQGVYQVIGLAYDPATLAPVANDEGVEMVPLFEVTVTQPR